MNPDCVFRGCRTEDGCNVLVWEGLESCELIDFLDPESPSRTRPLGWGDFRTASQFTAYLILYAATGDSNVADWYCGDFLACVLSRIRKDEWELTARMVQESVRIIAKAERKKVRGFWRCPKPK